MTEHRPGAVTAYVALGSNLGDRLDWLRKARAALAATPGLSVESASPAFETDAVATSPQPPYLNAVLRVTSKLRDAADLLAACLAVERALGRERPAGIDKAPRTIDVDLLLHGSDVVAGPGIDVPHPRLLERPFVRIPLAAVAVPGLVHPVTGEALDRASPSSGVRSFAARW